MLQLLTVIIIPLQRKLLPLVFVALPIFFRLFLELLLFIDRHPLPLDAHLLHNLAGVPLWVYFLELFPLLLAKEDVRR